MSTFPVPPGRATLVRPRSSPSTSTQVSLLWTRLSLGETGRNGACCQRMGRSPRGFPALPPRPHLLAAAKLRQTGPLEGGPRPRAWSTGHPRASLLSPPPALPIRPPRTQIRRGFQGLSPTVRAGLRGKQFQQHHDREKKSGTWTPAF